MHSKQILHTIFKSEEADLLQNSNQAIKQYPFFEIAYLAKALAAPEKDNLHNAALLLNNELRLHYIINDFNGRQQDNTSIGESVSYIEEKSIVPNEIATSKVVENTIQEQIKNNDIVNVEETIDNNEVIKSNLVEENTVEQIVETEAISNRANEEKVETNQDEIIKELTPEKRENSIEIKENKFNEKNENALENALIPIEPYYAVDYFASQGIKIDPSQTPTDKLSVQLKSFTDWLKSMRKIDTKVIENQEVVEEVQHATIVHLAEDSLVKNEVLTENMVDVLVKQGKTNEAISLLEKLSLQDTSKSSYFASRIEQIKTS